MRIASVYFQSDEVVELARSMVGMQLHSLINGQHCSGFITETEAYAGINDRASHAFGGRLTKRTKVMYKAGGITYVYLCYGMHYLLNIVTGSEGNPHAVLIRAILPLVGKEIIQHRLTKDNLLSIHTDGPGKVCKALGINMLHNGISIDGHEVWLEKAHKPLEGTVLTYPRIGVHYAGADALLPYRFRWKET